VSRQPGHTPRSTYIPQPEGCVTKAAVKDPYLCIVGCESLGRSGVREAARTIVDFRYQGELADLRLNYVVSAGVALL